MSRKKVVIVDDEQSYRDGFKEFLCSDADVSVFRDPDHFAEYYQDHTTISSVYLIVLDYRFDTYDAYDKDLLNYIRNDLNYKGNVVLWSLEDNIPENFSNLANVILPKKFMKLSDIENELHK